MLPFVLMAVQAVQSYSATSQASKDAKIQSSISQAQAYTGQAREYAQLTNMVKQQGRANEALFKAESYNYANIAQNVGAMELQNSQLRSVMNQNRLQLGTSGEVAKAQIQASAGAVGAVGASVQAMQDQVGRDLDKALVDLAQTRQSQNYDMHSRNFAMYTQFYQNQQMVDTSEIDSAYLPQDPLDLGQYSSAGKGGFFPHLVGSALTFTANHYMEKWSLNLKDKNTTPQPVFPSVEGSGQAYPYPYR